MPHFLLLMVLVRVAIGLDNVFRVTEIPGLGPTAMRGQWEGADTFVIEATSVGNPVESRLGVTFTGDASQRDRSKIWSLAACKVSLHGTSQN